jgi:hypothetical protein
MQRELKSEYSGYINLRSLDQTAKFVDGLMSSAASDRLLAWFLRDAGADAAFASRAAQKLARAQNARLPEFAPSQHTASALP